MKWRPGGWRAGGTRTDLKERRRNDGPYTFEFRNTGVQRRAVPGAVPALAGGAGPEGGGV